MGYHVSIAVPGGTLTRSEEVWIPAVLATLCALFGASVLKNAILSVVGSGTVSPVRKSVEVLGRSYISPVVMLFYVLVWETYTPDVRSKFDNLAPEVYSAPTLENGGATLEDAEPAWYVRQSRRGAKRSLSRGRNWRVITNATLLSFVLLSWEFFLLYSQTVSRGSVLLDHKVENEVAHRKPFNKSVDLDEADLKCKVTDITADAYLVVSNSFLSCRTISKSSKRVNGTTDLEIRFDQKDNYFLRVSSSDSAWYSVVSQSVLKPGDVVRATLQYEGDRRAQTERLVEQLTAAVRVVSGAYVTNVTFVEGKEGRFASLSLSKHLTEDENRKLLRAVSAYVLRITNVKQGGKGRPVLTVDDGSGAKNDQSYTAEIAEYAVPRLGSRVLLILFLCILIAAALQNWFSKDENSDFERLLWNGVKMTSPCNEEYSEFRDTDKLAPLMSRRPCVPAIHLAPQIPQGYEYVECYDGSIIGERRAERSIYFR